MSFRTSLLIYCAFNSQLSSQTPYFLSFLIKSMCFCCILEFIFVSHLSSLLNCIHLTCISSRIPDPFDRCKSATVMCPYRAKLVSLYVFISFSSRLICVFLYQLFRFFKPLISHFYLLDILLHLYVHNLFYMCIIMSVECFVEDCDMT